MSKVSRSCPVCNQSYETDSDKLVRGRGTTCSRKCSYALRALKAGQRFKNNKIDVVCDCCGSIFKKRKSQVANRNFCSKECSTKPQVLPIGHICGSWVVISDKLHEGKYSSPSQLCRCKCGKEELIPTHRLKPQNKSAVGKCKECVKYNYIHISKESLYQRIVVLGKTISEVATEFNCSAAVVARRMQEHGITLPVSDAHFLEGKRFGKWTVVKKIIIKGNQGWARITYECKCDCGATQRINAGHLLDGTSNQCRQCLGKEKRANKHHQWTGCGELTGCHFSTIRGGARRREIDFSISPREAWDLFLKQQKKCALTGISLEMKQRDYNREGCFNGTASLDRIDSKAGYVLGNIQWVHKTINLMKWDIEQTEFLQLCFAVCDWNQSRKIIQPISDWLEVNGDLNLNFGKHLKYITSYSGMNLGFWKVGEQTNDIKKSYRCTCACGKTEIVLHSDFKRGRRRCCRDCIYNFRCGHNSPHFKGYKGIIGDYWGKLTKGAINRQLPFDITPKDAWELYLQQGGRCAYTGYDLKLKRNFKDQNWTASLDRIDSSKGYSLDNVQWVHKNVNRMKLDFSEDEFIEWCAKICDYNKRRKDVSQIGSISTR